MILVISSTSDEHAEAVRRELASMGAPAALLDLSTFPTSLSLAVRYDDGKPPRFTLDPVDGQPLDLATVGAIWWRRPQPFRLDPGIGRPSHRDFAYGESAEAFAGLWQTLDPFWINHPTRDRVAARKLHQLRLAREIGLDIPATLITNEPDEAREFIAKMGPEQTVYKSFSATQQEWRETRLLRKEEMDLLDNVRHAPVIFQEYVEAAYDLRITLVGDAVFAAAIQSQQSAYQVDCRMDLGRVPIEPAEVPADVVDRLQALMAHLGIVYGAVDMRRTPAGRHVFLEVNPAGQWLFIEQKTGQPITRTLATLLAEHGGRTSPRQAPSGG